EYCGFFELLIPKWAAKELTNAYRFARSDQMGSWDELFGKPNGKSHPFKPGRRTPLSEKLRRERIASYVGDEVLKARHQGRAIDNELFDEIGRELGVGGRTEVKRLYKMAKEEAEPFWDALWKLSAPKRPRRSRSTRRHGEPAP